MNPRLFLIVLVVALRAQFGSAADAIDFEHDVAPILQQHCLSCHSDNIRKGDVSLTTIADILENEYLVPQDANASHLMDLISGSEPEMPKEGEPLEPTEIETIRRWIESGAGWPDNVTLREQSKADSSWWSLQPLATQSSFKTIDEFIRDGLSAEDLRMNPQADRRTLIRRATYDLTGLPPTPAEVDAFLNDKSPHAYEQLIDRLLSSQHYGERWGRHWLDVTRFGESNGFERNVIIGDLWPFRDYVIKSLNEDKPFDDFIRQHLAGDVIDSGNPDVEIGSAFLVAGPYDNVGNKDAAQVAQIRANTIDEMIRATTEAFLGLTVGCARCHDHKFDPILQQDYYQLYASFAGVRHGSRVVATQAEQNARKAQTTSLERQKRTLTKTRDDLKASVQKRAADNLQQYTQGWKRNKVERTGTEESFPEVEARFLRFTCEAADSNPASRSFRVDEFEVWSTGPDSFNVALLSNGGKASGPSRVIEDFPGAYGPQLAIDGKFGARFISTSPVLLLEFAKPQKINRVFFSSARNESTADQSKFAFVADYRIEVSLDGETWQLVADGSDREAVNKAHRDHRLFQFEVTEDERKELAELDQQIKVANRKLNAIPKLRSVWVGNHVDVDAKGPFHVFVGGSPQRRGQEVTPASMSTLQPVFDGYSLASDSDQFHRRTALADWIVHPQNPLTPRVLANRLWHYHFGTGIVRTPNDFGYMGEQPSHPELLDFLASELIKNDWRIKPLHKRIMMSQTYQQSSQFRDQAATVDAEDRLLWRFPPRRLSAEEIRDTMLSISGKMDKRMGGPGFRLYQYLQDNVATYVPLDKHGPETFRRAIYHQNARASRTDLMTDFDQPDCAFSTARRAATTTPLQALTTLNHDFTIVMAQEMARRLEKSSVVAEQQVKEAFLLCYGRPANDTETQSCLELIRSHGLAAFCRVLMNTSELIYVL